MTFSRPALLVTALITLLLAYPVFADEKSTHATSEQILAHPEVKGAFAAIDAFIEAVQIYYKVPGISAGIVSDQDLIWKKGYGYANPSAKRPADADTLYSICSISKLFTSIGIMQLRDSGKLRLRDSVNQHLDWFNIQQVHAGSGPITIESLLTHSSGLPRESDFPDWNGPDFPFPTREQLIDRLTTQETLYPAQHYYQYSNLALSLAGEIIQEHRGRTTVTIYNSRFSSPWAFPVPELTIPWRCAAISWRLVIPACTAVAGENRSSLSSPVA